MAIDQHVDAVRGGFDAYRKWRENNPNERLDLSDSSITGAEVPFMDFRLANLKGCSFKGSKIWGCKFQGAVAEGVDFSNTDFTACNFDDANLSRSTFHDSVIRTSSFVYSNMERCTLVGANFWLQVNLQNADLQNSDLRSTTFFDTDLTAASLRCCYILGTNFWQSSLVGTDFAHSLVGGSTFNNINLGVAKNLIHAKHREPSSVGLDTLLKSGGTIPHEFLAGCGVPKWMQHVSELCDRDLTANDVSEVVSTKVFGARTDGPIFMGGVFISCSSSDRPFVELLEKKLKDNGVPVWVYYQSLLAGSIERQISTAIGLQHVVIVVLSESSLASDWVWHEVEQTRKLEQSQNRDILCPIAIDDAWTSPSGLDISVKRQLDEHGTIMQYLKKKHILEFRKDQVDDGRFEKLIRGMKINYPMPSEHGANSNHP